MKKENQDERVLLHVVINHTKYPHDRQPSFRRDTTLDIGYFLLLLDIP